MKFDYYYGEESEQYSFYSVPKMFFSSETFAGLSAMSKLLYGFLLDRMSLSRKRNWIDDKNRAYIKYSLNAITKDMNVSKNSVIKYMKELQEFGLIMKFPNEGMEDVIYVMDFSKDRQPKMNYGNNADDMNGTIMYLDNFTESEEYEKDTGQTGNAPPDFTTHIALSNRTSTKKIQNPICKGKSTLRGGSESEPVQNLNRFKTCTGSKSAPVQNLHHPHEENKNNIYNNITRIDKTDIYTHNNLSYPSINPEEPDGKDKMDGAKCCTGDKSISEKAINADKLYEHMCRTVKNNIDYDNMIQRPECAGWYDEYYNLIVEVLVRKADTIKISGEEYSSKMVKNRFINLKASDLMYVHTQMSRTTSDIRNIKAYLIKALFNAPTTQTSYYQNRVNHDAANKA